MKNAGSAVSKAFEGNVRPSFFGGVVSTRLQAQDMSKIPVHNDRFEALKKKKAERNGDTTAPGKRLVASKQAEKTPAELKAQKQQQLQEKRRRMQQRMNAQMNKDVGDTYVPEVQKPAAVKKPKPQDILGVTKDAQLKRAPQGHGNTRPQSRQQPKPSEKRIANGQKVMIHTATRPPEGSKPGGQRSVQRAVKPSTPAAKPSEPSKTCRNCRKEKPLTEFFGDKRLADGVMHICGACAQLKGLSGKLLTKADVAKLFPAKTKAAVSEARPPGSLKTHSARVAQPAERGAPGSSATPSMRPVPGTGRFYESASQRMAPAVASVRSGMHRRPVPEMDSYEEDFVVDDCEEEDWRKELRQVTRGYYREERSIDGGDRGMEATAADIRREEARSKRLGRQEDAEAEREELERLKAKAAAKLERKKKQGKKKKRRTGINAFVADEASDSDSDEDEE